MTKNLRQLVGEDLLELPQPDLLVELVQSGGFHLDQHVMIPEHGLRDVYLLQRLLVLGEDEGFHGTLLG
ncbi:hypothetical protein D3C73_1427520 [compost metagenome]